MLVSANISVCNSEIVPWSMQGAILLAATCAAISQLAASELLKKLSDSTFDKTNPYSELAA
jgi:hypothetical protein